MMVALAIGWIILLIPHPDLPTPFVLSIPMLALGTNFDFIWALARLQNGAYKRFKREGHEALQKYEYNVDDALFFGGIVTLVCSLFAFFIIQCFDLLLSHWTQKINLGEVLPSPKLFYFDKDFMFIIEQAHR
jgi:hypothetical protein